jgi:hypothetical protein
MNIPLKKRKKEYNTYSSRMERILHLLVVQNPSLLMSRCKNLVIYICLGS